MADQLPQITGSRAVNSTVTPTTSLIGRGLSAVIQNKEIAIAKPELDARYRKARDIYDRITNYSHERRFNSEDMPKRGKQFDVFEDNPLQPYYDLLQQLADAFIVFQELADQDYGSAYFPLARMYEGGQGINQDIEKSDYYSHLAFSYCFEYQTLNEPEIWRDLGSMYANGKGVEQNDEQALFWYRKAAGQGDRIAQSKLGGMYLLGHGVELDYKQAFYWALKAAEQGNRESQYLLGCLYHHGYGVERNIENAVSWYRNVANQNHKEAQFILGWMHEVGLGVEKDTHEALFWYRKLAEENQSAGNTGINHKLIDHYCKNLSAHLSIDVRHCLLERICKIKEILTDVYVNSLTYWVEGFELDAYPEREIAIWECMAFTYKNFVEGHTIMSDIAKSEVFKVISSISLCKTNETILNSDYMCLGKYDIQEIIDCYQATATKIYAPRRTRT
jgi:uncharacterized protein